MSNLRMTSICPLQFAFLPVSRHGPSFSRDTSIHSHLLPISNEVQQGVFQNNLDLPLRAHITVCLLMLHKHCTLLSLTSYDSQVNVSDNIKFYVKLLKLHLFQDSVTWFFLLVCCSIYHLKSIPPSYHLLHQVDQLNLYICTFMVDYFLT